MNKGFVLSMEAVISLILFILLFISIPQPPQISFKELIAIEQANDLLKVWSVDFKIDELKSDVEFMFNKNVTLIVDKVVLVKSELNNQSVSTSGIILDKALKERKIELIIYFN